MSDQSPIPAVEGQFTAFGIDIDEMPADTLRRLARWQASEIERADAEQEAWMREETQRFRKVARLGRITS